MGNSLKRYRNLPKKTSVSPLQYLQDYDDVLNRLLEQTAGFRDKFIPHEYWVIAKYDKPIDIKWYETIDRPIEVEIKPIQTSRGHYFSFKGTVNVTDIWDRITKAIRVTDVIPIFHEDDMLHYFLPDTVQVNVEFVPGGVIDEFRKAIYNTRDAVTEEYLYEPDSTTSLYPMHHIIHPKPKKKIRTQKLQFIVPPYSTLGQYLRYIENHLPSGCGEAVPVSVTI